MKLNRLEESQQVFQGAIDVAELMRMELIDPEQRSSVASTYAILYKQYIELLMERNKVSPSGDYDASAFEMSERSRARSILELLEEAHVNLRKDADLKLIEEEKHIGDQITSQTKALESARRSKSPDVVRHQTQLENLLAQRREIEEKIRTTSPRYASITRPEPVSVEEVQGLLDRDTALLEINLGSNGQGFMWLVEKNKFSTFSLNNSLELERKAKAYYEAVSAPGVHVRFESAQKRLARIQKAKEEERKSGAAISEALLQPILPSLKERTILIVAEGALQYVPFTALPIPGTSQLMVSRYEVVELPSASVLRELRGKRSANSAYRPIAVFADPVFDARDPRVQGKPANSTRPGAGVNVAATSRNTEAEPISRVSNSRLEAIAIERLVPKKDFAEFSGFAATREQATKPEMSRFRTIHFATHGFVNTQHEELSGIVLSLVTPDGQSVDGFLQTHDVFDMNLPADLVVLSGCKTGLGHESNSEGLVGITRGFMYAGTSRVLVSLWDVDDAATAALMAEFYRGLLGPQKLPPAVALQRAQLKLKSQPRWSHPYYWAGFVLQGDPN
jgi:CHAT domain-containing protein